MAPSHLPTAPRTHLASSRKNCRRAGDEADSIFWTSFTAAYDPGRDVLQHPAGEQ